MPLLPRRTVLGTPLALALPTALQAAGSTSVHTEGGRKILRVAFSSAHTSLDPARIGDLYSRTITAHVFEALYGYDHLARPPRLVPVLAEGEAEPSENYKVWTVRLQRGIYFADDPCFQGRRRELTGADVFYGIKRVVDPANKGPAATSVLDEGIVGLAELRKASIEGRRPFDYDAPVAGMTLLSSHVLQFRLTDSRPRFPESMLSYSSIYPPQAREAVEHYGERYGDHPVGMGPFKVERVVHGSRITLVRNPQYRGRIYDARPAPDDATGQAIAARLAGRRLPMVDEVQVSIIEQDQPLWLSFANADIDALAGAAGSLPVSFAPIAVPQGRLAPHLARRGVQLDRSLRADVSLAYFNMDDPVVGGLAPERVALRRAISLAYDVETQLTQVRRGQAVRADALVPPHTSGYDPAFRSTMREYDPARARALLDLYGYLDRNGDGWREQPDGRPLELTISSEPEQIYRQLDDVWLRSLKAVGIRCRFEIQQWPAHYKQAQAGKLQIWTLGNTAGDRDGQVLLQMLYGPQAGQQNLARFKLPAFDRLYERMLALPDGPERERLFLEAKRIAAAYMPYRVFSHRMANDLLHPWVIGYRRPVFWQYWWHLVDVDMARAPARSG